jgi:hypothetical protein
MAAVPITRRACPSSVVVTVMSGFPPAVIFSGTRLRGIGSDCVPRHANSVGRVQ